VESHIIEDVQILRYYCDQYDAAMDTRCATPRYRCFELKICDPETGETLRQCETRTSSDMSRAKLCLQVLLRQNAEKTRRWPNMRQNATGFYFYRAEICGRDPRTIYMRYVISSDAA